MFRGGSTLVIKVVRLIHAIPQGKPPLQDVRCGIWTARLSSLLALLTLWCHSMNVQAVHPALASMVEYKRHPWILNPCRDAIGHNPLQGSCAMHTQGRIQPDVAIKCAPHECRSSSVPQSLIVLTLGCHGSCCEWLQPSGHCPAAGTLPASWANMSQLSYLLLQNNSLSGSLTASWGQGALPKLYNLNLSNNHVSPAIVHDLKHFSACSGCLVALR